MDQGSVSEEIVSTTGRCPFTKKRKLDDSRAVQCENGDSVNFPDDMLENLKQFHVLDEVQGDNSDDDANEGNGNESSAESDDFNLEEIESMLDENLPEELRNTDKTQQYNERYKIVLEEKGKNHFEVLPEGWVQATHNSGIPIYLHRQSRVCTVSRPYFLGPGSVRKHEVPVSAVPCLNYRKALVKEKQLQEEVDNAEKYKDEMDEDVSNSVSHPVLKAKIETVDENLKSQSLTAAEVTQYCKSLFKFKTIRVMRFKSWTARRKFNKSRKHIKNLQRPTLPDGTKLITFPILNTNSENGNNNVKPRKEWIMNPNGKSFVCILHEYVQHAWKKQPTYEFKELENAATPYSATVSIDGLKYGTGYGTSKKQAKSEAARESLEVLIPEMRDKITGNDKNKQNGSSENQSDDKDLSIFDEIKIEDPRVAEFCAKTTEPSPHTILLTCLQRNFGTGDTKIQYEVNTLKHKRNEFKMTVGKHTATVTCKNKKDGKQRASQAILQILHPHITNWGSLLRLYGNRSVKSFKEKKQEEQEITVLQSKAAENQPNYAILEKLQIEMLKLKEKQNQRKIIGTFVPDVDLPTGSGSNLNNVDL